MVCPKRFFGKVLTKHISEALFAPVRPKRRRGPQ